jgi:hypothetical protein
MIFYGHAPIISHNVDTTFLNLSRGKIPATGITDVRFIYLFFFNKELPLTKFNSFTLECEHPFEKHHFGSGKTDCDHLMPRGLRGSVPLPAEIDTSISIVRLHAKSLNDERDTEMAKK